jgi:hypothetical protein
MTVAGLEPEISASERPQTHSLGRATTEIRYNILSLSVRIVLYGCETWSLTLREERRLRLLENKVLRRIFGLKRDEVIEEWRKLHKEELYDLYSSLNIIRLIRSKIMR